MKKLNRTNVDTKQYPVKVLQFGDGNFLRGFADWMVQKLNDETAFSGSVVTVAPLRRDRPSVPDGQDNLYHVVLRGITEGQAIDSVQLISCVTQCLNPYAQFDQFIGTADIPTLCFVISNTTEAGISFNEGDTLDKPADAFPAKVTQLLYRRFQNFQGDRSKGLIFLPCELIENNGSMLRKLVLRYAAEWSLPERFTAWVNHACLFCNTLVDRIVTGYPAAYAPQIEHRTGFEDKRMVAAEPYHLWVIEADESLQEMLPVKDTQLNIKFTSNLAPYRISKVRILNGAHTAMTMVGYLRGLRTVQEAIEDPWMAVFLQELVAEEIIPTVPLPVDEVTRYAHQVFARFRNPDIRHELKSIALNSVSKFKTRLLPTLLDYHTATGKLPARLVQTFAALIVFYRGSWRGEILPVHDNAEALTAMAECWAHPDAPRLRKLLSNETLWGSDLNAMANLETALQEQIDVLNKS